MEPIATSQAMAADMPDRTAEIHDFDEVIRLHWSKIFRFVLASLRDRDAAECVTQDCFIRAFKGRTGFRGQASIQTWLMKIAVNLVRDSHRSRKLQFWKRASREGMENDVTASIAAPDLSPEAQTLIQEELRTIWEVTARLPERQRTAFLLRFVEDMSLLEISRAMGLTEGAVKKHLFRAVHAVRERIGRDR
jgi:RNA polymerase sigma-70 factor (ECF subfamily)